MVFERLLSPQQVEGHPWEMYFLGAFHANIAIIAAYTLVRQFASLTAIAFTVMLALPFVYTLLMREESQYSRIREEKDLLRTHLHFFKEFLYLFLGFTTTFGAWYVFAPASVVSVLYTSQEATIQAIRGITGQALSFGSLSIIVSHNVQVLLACVLLSFVIGTGALYVLVWNASVLGVGMGSKLREGISAAVNELGAGNLSAYFNTMHLSFLAYLVHGIPEMLAYIVGGILGGTLSFAYSKGELHTEKRNIILEDTFILFIAAVGLLLIAGMLEVVVTPRLL